MTPENDTGAVYKTVATRLAAARRASGLNQIQVAQKVGQKNMTQVSLWESGARLPKLLDVIEMSKAYNVPMDFICGLSDDPIADAAENNQAFLANMIGKAVQGAHMDWLNVTAKSIATTLNGRGQDRTDLRETSKALGEFRAAFDRFVELNPEFEDEMSGSANLLNRLVKLEAVVHTASGRIDDELEQRNQMDREISLADGAFMRRAGQEVELSVNQQLLDLAS